jgi:hypothetical protein
VGRDYLRIIVLVWKIVFRDLGTFPYYHQRWKIYEKPEKLQGNVWNKMKQVTDKGKVENKSVKYIQKRKDRLPVE